jgi:hypothetical protein
LAAPNCLSGSQRTMPDCLPGSYAQCQTVCLVLTHNDGLSVWFLRTMPDFLSGSYTQRQTACLVLTDTRQNGLSGDVLLWWIPHVCTLLTRTDSSAKWKKQNLSHSFSFPRFLSFLAIDQMMTTTKARRESRYKVEDPQASSRLSPQP